MAIPSLKEKAYLTLFHNPHMQPEGWSVDYSDLSAPARAIQRWVRRRGVLNRAATTINKLIRAFGVRCFISRNQHFLTSNLLVNRVSAFLMYGFQPGYWGPLFSEDGWWEMRDRLISPRNLRSGRRDLARRRDIAERQDTRVYVGRYGRRGVLTVFHVDRWPIRRYQSTNLETLEGRLHGLV